jgi:predicted aspartyl protease
VAIPIIYFGKLLVVPVTLTHGTSSATGYFFVDTGASQTVISKRIARDLRLMAVDTGISFGIGGAVSNDIALVDSIRVGRAGLTKTAVSIHDFSPDPRLEGLLGLDFLSRFQMSVDVGKRVMTLTPR